MKPFIILFSLLCLFCPSTLFAQENTLIDKKTEETNTTKDIYGIESTEDKVTIKKGTTALLEMDEYAGTVFTGVIDWGIIPKEGDGVRMMWYPKKAVFRAGYVGGSQWDDINVGYFSSALGTNTTASGDFSTAMGHRTTASGDYSTAMGSYVNISGDGSFFIGDNSLSSIPVASTTSNMFFARFDNGYRLYTNSGRTAGVKLDNNSTSWLSVSDSTKKENYMESDGEYFLNSISDLRLGSWNFKDQDPKKYRHYGPMAQEIYHYFGNDEYGTIGNDTTLATADMDGIMMIALKALEKRTKEQRERIKYQEARIKNLEEQNFLVNNINMDLRNQNNGLFINNDQLNEKILHLESVTVINKSDIDELKNLVRSLVNEKNDTNLSKLN